MLTKICNKCSGEFSLEHFNDTCNVLKDGTVKEGKQGSCKACQKIYRDAYYIRKKEEEMQNQRLRRMQLKKFNR